MKNIVVGVLTLFIVALMAFTAMDDPVFHGGEHSKVIENFGDGNNQQVANAANVLLSAYGEQKLSD